MITEINEYKDEIDKELKKILSHTLFKGARRSSSFLRYVCEKAIAGESHQIKEFSIAVDAFGLEMTFDQQMDPRIRVEAKRLRDRLKQYYEGPGCDDPIQIRLEKGSYVPVFQKSETAAAVTQEEGAGSPGVLRSQTDKSSLLLENRFLISLDLPETKGDEGADFFVSCFVQELFDRTKPPSLSLDEIIRVQKEAYPLVLSIGLNIIGDNVYFILRLKLKEEGTLLHSEKKVFTRQDLENSDYVENMVHRQAEELLDFCRSVNA
ncbi:MAG: hypothetical protein PQJ58_07540 [Spirochaetales bacterium]|nr:hypothetical protein [Spirochaetales bacterium]